MGRRETLAKACAQDLRSKCGMPPEEDLLDRIITACGPAAFAQTGAFINPDDPAERDHVRSRFLVRKLGLKDGPDLSAAIDAAFEAYPNSDAPRLRPVIYYLLVKFFGREAAL